MMPGRRVAALVATIAMTGMGLAVFSGPAAATTVATEAELRAAFGDAGETQIDLAADIDVTCAGGGELVRNSTTALTIDGHGFTLRGTCPDNGILDQNGTGALTVMNIVLTGGDTDGTGGAVFTNGDLSVSNAVVDDNSADAVGGGLFADGALEVATSSITNNMSPNGGGGLFSTTTIEIVDSTIAGNGGSGGVGADGAVPITIVNSTVSGNEVAGAGSGAGVATDGLLTLVYATIANNSAAFFANLDVDALTSFASVVALAQGGGVNCLPSTTTSHGYNYSDDPSCGFGSGDGDVTNGPDPQLGPLGDNSGPTQTMEPAPGSPLLDAIPPASCQADGASGVTTDQRGVTRPQGAGCDIGAVEVEVAPPLPIVPPAPAPPLPIVPPAAAPPTPVAAVVRFTG